MDHSLSQQFINAVETRRDRLYSEALLLAKTPDAAEGLLQKVLRAGFHAYAEGQAPTDLSSWIRGQLYVAAGVKPVTDPPSLSEPMPAATWARLTAGVQVEAAKSGASKALNPESVLLTADPLLAPKKHVSKDDPMDGMNMSPVSRFVLAVAVALVIGISLSLYYCTRTVPTPATKPATLPSVK